MIQAKHTNPYKELIVNNAEKIEPIVDTNAALVHLEQYTQLYTIWQASKKLSQLRH